jgi:hypothetical protein
MRRVRSSVELVNLRRLIVCSGHPGAAQGGSRTRALMGLPQPGDHTYHIVVGAALCITAKLTADEVLFVGLVSASTSYGHGHCIALVRAVPQPDLMRCGKKLFNNLIGSEDQTFRHC